MNIDSENTMRFVRRNMVTVKNKLLNKHSEAESHFVRMLNKADIDGAKIEYMLIRWTKTVGKALKIYVVHKMDYSEPIGKGKKDCLVIGNCFGNSFSKKFG